MHKTPISSGKPMALGDLPVTPLVSIVTSNYNYAQFIGDAIESVLAQTYANFEMIICDDGSTDDSVSRITPYTLNDDRIRLVRKQNGGQASAWNQAFKESSGDIICLLDSDDRFISNKLEEVVRVFGREPESGLLVHPMLIVDREDNVLRRLPAIPDFDHGWIGPKVIRNQGRWQAMPSSAMSLRREVAQVIFPIEQNELKTCADSFVMRIGPLLTCVTSVEQPLTQYRSHGTNSTGKGDPLDLNEIQRRSDNTHRTCLAINNRLIEFGLDDRLLPPHRSRLAMYRISLLDGSKIWERVVVLLPLVSETLREELDSPPKRIAKLVVYLLSLVLPRRARATLMHRFFSVSSYYHKPRPWQTWSVQGLRYRISKGLPLPVANA